MFLNCYTKNNCKVPSLIERQNLIPLKFDEQLNDKNLLSLSLESFRKYRMFVKNYDSLKLSRILQVRIFYFRADFYSQKFPVEKKCFFEK